MLGMILLAYMDDKEKERLLKLYPPTKITTKTVTEARRIMKKLTMLNGKAFTWTDEIVGRVAWHWSADYGFFGQCRAALGALSQSPDKRRDNRKYYTPAS